MSFFEVVVKALFPSQKTRDGWKSGTERALLAKVSGTLRAALQKGLPPDCTETHSPLLRPEHREQDTSWGLGRVAHPMACGHLVLTSVSLLTGPFKLSPGPFESPAHRPLPLSFGLLEHIVCAFIQQQY